MRRRGRRHATAWWLCALVLAGCTPEVEEPEAKPPSDGPTVVAPGSDVAGPPEPECAGIGPVPRAGQITFREDNQLQAASPSGDTPRCLLPMRRVRGVLTFDRAVWNGPGDRFLLANRALSADGPLTRVLAPRAERLQWSRPSGMSLVSVTPAGALLKRPSNGGDATDIGFLRRHDAVTYHPAGEHIATSGLAKDGSYGLYLATNLGTEPQLLAHGEAARFITNLQVSEDGQYLYYTARHGVDDWHLHRLVIDGDGRLETLARNDVGFEYIVSPFDSRALAWFVPSGDCALGTAGTFAAPGRRLQIPEKLRHRNIIPVGWLPGGDLVVRAKTTGCSTAQPADIYVLSRDGAPTLVKEEDYGSVSVRVAMPRPPPPPHDEQDIVA